MPTALADWTPERPDAPGFYWWMRPGNAPEVVELYTFDPDDPQSWFWNGPGDEVGHNDTTAPAGALWWPVRLDPPPVG